MEKEAVLLTGGASRRMGRDKATLPVLGLTLADRILAELDAFNVPVTILGVSPIDGRKFVPDRDPGAGPALALARFVPAADAVFVLSCDMPLFNGEVVPVFAQRLGDHDAVVPEVGGHRQTLCALYAARAFHRFADAVNDEANRSMKSITRSLNVRSLNERELEEAGIDPLSVCGVNTPQELTSILEEAHRER